MNATQAEANRASWQHVVDFYKDLINNPNYQFAAPILAIANEISATEHSQLFRAGTSLWHLLISTSLEHGLKDNEPFIAITVKKSKLTIEYWSIEPRKVVERSTIEGDNIEGDNFRPALDRLLSRLQNETKSNLLVA